MNTVKANTDFAAKPLGAGRLMRLACLTRAAYLIRAACTALLLAASPFATDAARAQSPAEPAAPDSGRTAATGIYTAAQAEAGKTVFSSICGNCHGTSQFNGPTFRSIWAGQTVYTMFDQLYNTMPLDNPGGLTREQYAAVIAYILELNRFPAGDTELPVADSALKQIRF